MKSSCQKKEPFTSKKKHQLFYETFAPVLLPRGFIYTNRKFIRVHRRATILVMGLNLIPSYFGPTIRFAAYPFAQWSNRHLSISIVNGTIPCDAPSLEQYLHSITPRSNANDGSGGLISLFGMDETSFTVWLQKMKDGFEKHVMEVFHAVTTPHAYLAFERDFLSIKYHTDYYWGPCIQVGKYDEAEDYLFELYEGGFQVITDLKTKLNARDWDPSIESNWESELRSRIQKCDIYLADTLRAFEAVRARDYAACHAIIDECIRYNEENLKLVLKSKWAYFV